MTNAVQKLKELVDSSQNIVFFGGAGEHYSRRRAERHGKNHPAALPDRGKE